MSGILPEMRSGNFLSGSFACILLPAAMGQQPAPGVLLR